ncbi:MAG: hypothetical protein PHF24_01315 [Syntrophomonas sp.]|nr:hypothetical protein [Syntrophomonas sp.]
MITYNTSQKLTKMGIDPNSSIEDLIEKIEGLGYNGINLSRNDKGYKLTILYRENIYVYKQVLAENRKEAMALALVINDFLEYA